MKIRFFNAKILPLDECTPLFSGELATNGSTISYLGEDGSNFGPFDRTARSTAVAICSCRALKTHTRIQR